MKKKCGLDTETWRQDTGKHRGMTRRIMAKNKTTKVRQYSRR